ncbi:MAG: glycoside hydrolase family 5 protein [Cellvibrio sp.]
MKSALFLPLVACIALSGCFDVSVRTQNASSSGQIDIGVTISTSAMSFSSSSSLSSSAPVASSSSHSQISSIVASSSSLNSVVVTSSSAPIVVASSSVSSQIAVSSVAQSSSVSSSSAISSSVASSAAASSVSSGLAYRGVNLAGADFGERNLPGIYDTDYTYPTQSSVDYFLSKGMNHIRLPFRWERLQRSLNGNFDATEQARLYAIVESATAAGAYVLLDPHNYARYNNQIIGSNQVPYAAFADFWSRLANLFKHNPGVMFGLVNEPRDMPTEQWLTAANAAIAAIRQTGATNLIMVPGNAWTGAHSWNQSWYGTPNAQVMTGVVDPLNKFVIEVHQYFDSDHSGTDPTCTANGQQVLTEFTAWLRTHNLKGYLGEFAGADNAACRQAVEAALSYMQSNQDVWVGWAWWAAGPWWAEYMYTLEPSASGDRPQMQWLAPYL